MSAQQKAPAKAKRRGDRRDRQGWPADRRADRLHRADRRSARPPCRFSAGRGFARHGGLWFRQHPAGDGRDDGRTRRRSHPRHGAGARRRRSAVRRLSGIAGAGVPQCRADHGPDRLRRGQARRRRRDGRDRALSRPARGPGHGPCRADAAIGQYGRRVQGAGPRRRAKPSGSPPMPPRSPRLAPSRSSSRARSRRSRAPSPRRCRCRPSASARRPPATARSW